MKFWDYRVGLVVSHAGLTDGQLAVIRKMLADIAKHIEDGGKIDLYIPGWDLQDPEKTIPAEVLNLRYRDKVRVRFVGYEAHDGGAALSICAAFECDCDEIWCAPAMTHMGRSIARVNQVWTLGQASDRARLYKRIQPWASMPEATATPKQKPKQTEHRPHKQKKSKLVARATKKRTSQAYRELFNDPPFTP